MKKNNYSMVLFGQICNIQGDQSVPWDNSKLERIPTLIYQLGVDNCMIAVHACLDILRVDY